MANTASNRAIKIEDLQEKYNIGESNLIIVEDELDTKKATIKELRKSFSGDYENPSRDYYYSSKYINDLINTINIAISGKAPKEIIKELETKLNEVISNQIDPNSKDLSEIITARNGHATLSERLDYEREISNTSYMEKCVRNITGNKINIDGHNGLIDITPIPPENTFNSNAKGKIIYYSKNRLDISLIKENSSVEYIDNFGFKYTQNEPLNSEVIIPFYISPEDKDKQREAGTYYFMASITFSKDFTDKNIFLKITYVDGTTEQFAYDHSYYFSFDAKKSFTQLSLVYPSDSDAYITNEYVTFENVMLSKYKLNSYVEYNYDESGLLEYGNSLLMYNDDYIFEFSIPNANLDITYRDHTITVNTILDRISAIENTANNKIEKCGLMEDYGIYYSFDTCTMISSESSGSISNADIKYERNGFTSKKINIGYSESENIQIKQVLSDLPETLESVSLCFYIDKTIIEKFTDETGLLLVLCSDDPIYPDNVNRFQTMITRSEMIHGWNIIKRPLAEFVSYNSPDVYSIKSASLFVMKNSNLNGSEFYINSLSFNQKMKPTIIFSFDGTYENSIKNAYDFMTLRNIPATVLLNDSRTIDNEEFDNLIKLRIMNGWDIGAYGTHTKTINKESLLSDDNFRNQYNGLYANREFIRENVLDNPISYSAPYGNLRPITVPLLKDLGYKIARTEGDSFISIFTEKDFSIPMTLISNKVTEDEIIEKIDYTIANNVALSLFTRDVTEYGDEASAKITMFESIIDYIYEKVQKDELQVLTMAEFYHKCVD